MLDERGNPLTGTESSDRFSTFGEGPCPVLKALTSEVAIGTEPAALTPLRNGNESRNLAPNHFPTRPVLSVLTRLRDNLDGRS